MRSSITLLITCLATLAYLYSVGLLGDPRMIFLGLYGAGCTLFGVFSRDDFS